MAESLYTIPLDWYHEIPQRVQKILRKLQDNGHTAWLVGGAIRDRLIGRTPKDYDVVTNAKPEEIAKIFNRTIAIGAHFGVMVVIEDGEPTEVATFRKDGFYLDARHPESVEFASPEEDSHRRDFTMNGLYWDPISKNILDYVGGIKDIENRTIRTIGRASARFQEDALRTLRALRFYSELSTHHFHLDVNLVTGIKRQGHLILQVSKERITEEILLILKSEKPSLALLEMKNTKLFERIFPLFRGLSQGTFDHLLYVVDNILVGWQQATHSRSMPEGSLFWAGFLQFLPNRDESIKSTNSVCIGKNETRTIRRILQTLNQIPDSTSLPLYRLKEILSMEEYFSASALYLTNCRLIKDGSFEFLQNKRKEFLHRGTLDPEPLVTGNDLIDMGIEPSPQFKFILEKIRKEQLEEQIHTKDEAMSLLRKFISN